MNDSKNSQTNLCILTNDLYEKFCLLEDNEIVFFSANFSKPIKGNVYVGVIEEIREALMGAFVTYDRNTRGFISFSSLHPDCFIGANLDIINQMKRSFNAEFHMNNNISHFIQKGQKILVQVTREPTSYKKAMLSTYISIGKKVTYIPNSINNKIFFHSTLSIKYKKEVDHFLKSNNIKGSFSIQKEVSLQDIYNEVVNWNLIQEKFESQKECGLIYESQDTMKTIFFNTKNVEKCIYNNSISENLKQEIRIYWPDIEFTQDKNIKNTLNSQINDIFQNTHQLKCGGFILWNLNHACTTIDVNIGHNQKENYEQSIISTNFEAVQTIAQQIKLKNIGGLIVIDFLKMNDLAQQEMINDYMAALIKQDYAKIKLEKINSLGVMMLCRQYVNCGFNIHSIFKTDPVIAEYRLLDQLIDEIEIHSKHKLQISISKSIYEYIINHHSHILEKLISKNTLHVNQDYGFRLDEYN